MPWRSHIALALGCFCLLGSRGWAQSLINPSLEFPSHAIVTRTGPTQVTGATADGWADLSNGDTTVAYSVDQIGCHGGRTAQHIDVTTLKSGSVQFGQSVALAKDHFYTGTVYLRSATAMAVDIALSPGASKTVFVTPIWTAFSLSGWSQSDTPGTFLVRMTTPGTLWVDDASFVDSTDSFVHAPAASGNLLPNGSFEAGLANGWNVSMTGALDWLDPRPAVDNRGTFEGQQALRLSVPSAMSVRLCSPHISVNGGRVHTASIALKTDRYHLKAILSLEGTQIEQTVDVGRDWKRFSLTGLIDNGVSPRLVIRAFSPDDIPSTLWADAASLEERPEVSATYPINTPIELGLSMAQSGHIVFDGEPATILVSAGTSPPRNSTLRLTLIDLYGEKRSLKSVKFPVTSVTISPDKRRQRGMFKLQGQIFDAKGQPLSALVDLVFARLPQPRTIAPEISYFGAHFPLAPEYCRIARATGTRWTRLHDVSPLTMWPTAQAQRGADYQFYDPVVDTARDTGIAILGMLDGTPDWVCDQTNEKKLLDTQDVKDAWIDYVRSMIVEYKDWIQYWEVQSAPWDKKSFPGTTKQYGDLLKLASSNAAECDPSTVILGMSTVASEPNFTQEALAASGPLFYDVFTYHDYASTLYGGQEDQAFAQAETYRTEQRKYDAVKQLWMTEGAPSQNLASLYCASGDEQTARWQMTQIVRYDVCTIAAGVKHSFLYTFHGDPASGSEGLCCLEHDRAIRPILAARAVLASLIDGGDCLGRSKSIDGVDAFTFRQMERQTISVLWSNDGQPHRVPVQAGAQCLDIEGNPIKTSSVVIVGLEPVYVLHM